MGCLLSRAQPDEIDGPPAPRNRPSLMTSFSFMTSASGRGSTRQNNVVPIPEGLFTGSNNAEAPVQSLNSTLAPSRPQAPKFHNSATVRSLVNLKKHLLRLLPDGNRPGHYLLSFVVDSSVPCKVSIYIMAYEKDLAKLDSPPRLKSKHSKREPSHVCSLNGLEQPYCIPAGQGLPLGNFEEKQLTIQSCPPNQIYPVVIRIQALSAGGENGTANVQAQTTFATLVKQADGTYEIQVLKQVLWVNGTSYVLHEIFGIARSSEEENGGILDSSKECVICLAETRDTLAIPCRHLCLCSNCAKALCNRSNKCPLCRTVVQSLLQIKLAIPKDLSNTEEQAKTEPSAPVATPALSERDIPNTVEQAKAEPSAAVLSDRDVSNPDEQAMAMPSTPASTPACGERPDDSQKPTVVESDEEPVPEDAPDKGLRT